MEAIEGFKLFQVSEYEWYKARNIFDAIKTCMEQTGLSFDEACDEELHECTEEELDVLKYIDADTPGDPTECTFREQFISEMKKLPRVPGMFASTEY